MYLNAFGIYELHKAQFLLRN